MYKLTPMLEEYLKFKNQYPEFVIFYQVGDFYEVFFDDAKIVSNVLQIALTSRDKDDSNAVPMCGVPVSSVENYLTKLLDRGFSVVVISQRKDEGSTISRFVDLVLTPGIRIDLASDAKDYFIALSTFYENAYETCLLNLQTKHARVYRFPRPVDLISLVSAFEVKEFIVDKITSLELHNYTQSLGFKLTVTPYSGPAYDVLKRYLSRVNPALAEFELEIVEEDCSFFFNASAFNGLNILSPNEGDPSLFTFFNRCVTPMGTTELRKRFFTPFKDAGSVRDSHESIQMIINAFTNYISIRGLLETGCNLSKIAVRAELAKLNFHEAKHLKIFLLNILKVTDLDLGNYEVGPLKKLKQERAIIRRILENLAPINEKSSGGLDDLNCFLAGYFSEFDELVCLKTQISSTLSALEQSERQRTGIPTLKLKITQNFGILYEVTNSYKNLVPDYFIRRQTLVNCERYTTPELISLEEKIKNLDDELTRVTGKIWEEIKSFINQASEALFRLSKIIGELDLLITFAIIARDENFVKPVLVDKPHINISQGFHPLLKKTLRENYQTNDFLLDDENRYFVLTGPNMGGKSSFLRQLGVTVFINQIGSYVPANKATLGIFNQVLTRIGSEDFILKGLSTFMCECLDVSEILSRADEMSLVLIDELGRGTNSEEGFAFCAAVLNYLKQKRVPFLLATHFHQLNGVVPEVNFIQTEVLETVTGPVFTHRIKSGILNHSYSWFVARMAGIPDNVVFDAKRLFNAITVNDPNPG
ncbi:MAG: hypothetical protein NZT61_07245, partial [Deltaproteobacteria bacterium]|nr:hypothetical protein [Deltaproteobacteria bacterium]